MKEISKSAYNLPVFFINSSFSLNFMKLQILNYLFRRSKVKSKFVCTFIFQLC